jgi:hypothetical protein
MLPAPDAGAFLVRLAVAIEEGRVRITWKAADELAELGWSEADALQEIAALRSTDVLRTETPRSVDFTLIWVFCPLVAEVDRHFWIRMAEAAHGTIVISFHLAERDPWT